MSDAEHVPGDLDGLPAYLVRSVPGFETSPELASLPGDSPPARRVAAACGLYLLRLQRKAVRKEADGGETAVLDRAYAVLEELAGSEDPRVRGLLTGEILDRLHSDDVVVAVVETRLGPRSKPLFRRWAV